MNDTEDEFTDDTPPEEYAEHVKDNMDVREIVEVMCELHNDSKVLEELVVEVATCVGMERDRVTRQIREFVSTVEIVELEDGYIQDRAHFDEGFD
jgi:predicted nucleic acid-binding protein